MDSVLNLNDLIYAEIFVELGKNRYSLNTSLNAMVSFVKWAEKINIDNLSNEDITSYFTIVLKEPAGFIVDFNDLDAKSQTAIILAITKLWNKEMGLSSSAEESKKK